MKSLTIALLFASAAVSASASTVNHLFFYRPVGKVPFSADGIPQVTFTVSEKEIKHERLVHVAKASYEDSLFEIGWDKFTVVGDKAQLKEDALTGWYAAGYAEGYATMATIGQVLIAQAYNYSAPGQIWVNKHLEYVQSNALSKGAEDPFWGQVRKQLLQLEGMAAGYNARAVASGDASRVTFETLYQLNLYNEYDDIGPAAKDLYGDDASALLEEAERQQKKGHGHGHGGAASIRTSNKHTRPNKKDRLRIDSAAAGGAAAPKPVPSSEEHCSGLVKLTSDDLFMSHVTWCEFYIFVGRQHKTYMMETTVIMSSNAGLINSGGDWYQTSNKLSIIETTNEFTNPDLFKLIGPNCVAEFMRVMIASFLAEDAKTWTTIFSKEPSGTYCNQWMVLDYKLYTKGMTQQQLPDNLFWILETIPGTIMTADMTPFIREHGYWGSYNIPYFPNIYALSGFTQQLNAYGTDFSWSDCPRAQIFRRDHSKVTDLLSMQKIMRYNNWQNDPLSAIPNCTGCVPTNSPMLGISSRGDLVPSNASYGNLSPNFVPYFGFAYFGGTDAKISSYDMINDGFKASFINGPTHDTQPVFSWSVDPTNPLAKLPGMIQTFDFKWETLTPDFKHDLKQ